MTSLTLRPGLTYEAVTVGDELPELILPVTPRVVVQGAAASRDWQPQHHDHAWAQAKTGGDIFLNTPNQAGWIERYLTDWSGSYGRLGRLQFRMRRTVVPGDELVFRGVVIGTGVVNGFGWVDVEVTLTVTAESGEDHRAATTCVARIALPTDAVPNPWQPRGQTWNPGITLPHESSE